MTVPTDPPPGTVPATAKQPGSIYDRWPWVVPTVWSERMLTALEQGVKGGVWRWPNAYFATLGLYNLTTAHAVAGQSH